MKPRSMVIPLEVTFEVSGFVRPPEPSNGSPGDVKQFRVMLGKTDVTNALTDQDYDFLLNTFFQEKGGSDE